MTGWRAAFYANEICNSSKVRSRLIHVCPDFNIHHDPESTADHQHEHMTPKAVKTMISDPPTVNFNERFLSRLGGWGL